MSYQTKVRDIIALEHRISEANTTVTADMLARTLQEIEHGQNILHATGSAHIEVS